MEEMQQPVLRDSRVSYIYAVFLNRELVFTWTVRAVTINGADYLLWKSRVLLSQDALQSMLSPGNLTN